ncbi:hypothetical protein SBRCBS47491_002076 [Sporothrix bragantina]|uniref:Xylanolytic transcriptional activator regulatory domain-containing protein n=1 Tax=Sporothrix bragantina TaxID=671064 RepID=A0ABP0B3S8_9PEZI
MASMASVSLALPSPPPLPPATAATIHVEDIVEDIEEDSLEGSDFHDDDALVNLYYANFHSAHPILVPRSLYGAQHYPAYLRLVVHCIGSQFSMPGQSDNLKDAAVKAIENAIPSRKSHHVVQARLLLSIALHARGEIRESVTQIAQAVSTALDAGMHQRAYSTTHGGRSPIVEESLRRTWWELYVVDGFVAALQRSTSARSHACAPDVLLPCDEVLYGAAGGVEDDGPSTFPESPTLEQFDARLYADDDNAASSFSSFCYRIDAVRILVRALAVSSAGAHASAHDVREEQVQAIDNALAAWRHSEAAASRHPAAVAPEDDEMLFQAHMFVAYTAIYLHFWRSDLAATVPAAFDIIRERHLPPVATRHAHARTAVAASKQLVDLAARSATPAAVQRHTPFFVFVLVFSAIVQLSACAHHGPAFNELYRDRLALISGVLTTLGPVWMFANAVGRKFRRMTADLLRVHSAATQTKTQQMQPHTTSHIHTQSHASTTNKTMYNMDDSMDTGFQDVTLYGNAFPWMDLLTWDPEQGL